MTKLMIALRALTPLAKKAWPRARRIYRERQASEISSPGNINLLDDIFQDTLDRITGGKIDSAWWKDLLAAVEQPLVAPDFLRKPAIQEWLSDNTVQTHIKSIARARVMGSRINRDALATLRHIYSDKTGEIGGNANGLIDVVVGILAAGFLASIDRPLRPVLAAVQAVGAENRENFEKLQKQLDQSDSSHILVQACNKEVITRLSHIIKRRTLELSRIKQEIKNLAQRVLNGDMRHADVARRVEVLHWASRLHAGNPATLAEAKQYRQQLRLLKHDADTLILDALIAETEGDADSAIRMLRDVRQSEARSVLFCIMQRQSRDDALRWFDNQPDHDNPSFLTGFGWSIVAIALSEAGRWEEASEYLMKARIHDNDWPDLAYLEGLIVTALILPEEHRQFVWTMDVCRPFLHTMEGTQAKKLRQRADACFSRAERKMIEIGQEGRASAARMWRLWLRLKDRQSREEQEARKEVQEGLKDVTRAIEFLPFAQTFDIPFDAGPIRDFLERRKRMGGLNEAETFAEVQLAELTMAPRDFAAFLEKDDNRLASSLSHPGSKAMLTGKRIEALVKDGQPARARRLLEERREEFTGDYERLGAMISAWEGGDPRADLERIYQQTQELIDLHNLIICVGGVGDWQALMPLLKEQFRRERTAKNAYQLVDCMRRVPDADDGKIVEFFKENEDLIPQHPELASEMAWALFRLGNWREAKSINDDLLKERHARVDVALDINLAILLGETERFAVIVEREEGRSQDLDPSLLMLLATIAAEVDATEQRAFDFAALAAEKALNNPKILVNAYILAVQLGKENDARVGEWMARAIAQSNADGPVWKVDLRKVAEEMMPAHRVRTRRIEEMFLGGEIPIHLVSDALNLPLSRMFLDIPRLNDACQDGRQLVVVPIASAARLPVEVQPEWSVGFDVTSIMVLWHCDLLALTFKSFQKVVLAPDIMPLLLNERRRVRYHQPSRVKDAEAILGLHLKELESLPDAPQWLIEEVGIELAQLLEKARITDGYVVHPLPLRKLKSYAEQEADVKEYENVIISTNDFTSMLFEKGHITEAQKKKALAYLLLHDRRRNESIDSSRLDRVLHLDDLAVLYLQSAGILQAVCSSRMDIRVHPSLLSELQSRIAEARHGKDLSDSLDGIRGLLHNAISEGKAVFLPRNCQHVENEESEQSHIRNTQEQFLTDLACCDAVCIDDRFLNKHQFIMDMTGRSVPMICLFDILRYLTQMGLLDEKEKYERLHNIRKAGFSFVPLEPAELELLVKRASLDQQNKQLRETAQLRVLRRTLMKLRSLDIIQQPSETPFLDRLRLCCVSVILRSWRSQDLSTEHVLALTDWLWRNVSPSPLDWSRTAHGKTGMMSETEGFALHVELLLRIIPAIHGERREIFRKWIENTVLEPLLPGNAELVDAVTTRVRGHIEERCKEYGKDA